MPNRFFDLFFVAQLTEVNDNRHAEDYEKMAKELENASPLQIIDKALEKFGNDIAIAFRYLCSLLLGLGYSS